MKRIYPHIKLSLVLMAFFLLSTVASSCGSETGSKIDHSEIDEIIRSALEKHSAPGAIVGIWIENEDPYIETWGNASIDPEKPMDDACMFRIGSITKTFTGNIVLQLIDEKKLDLSDPINKYVEGVPNGDSISIEMLLGHTSGLFDYGADEIFVEQMIENPLKVWTPEELIEASARNEPYFEPGTACLYANVNYIILGMAIERITGNSFEEELRERVITPVGLERTYMADTIEISEDFCMGYGLESEETDSLIDMTQYMDPSITWTAGAMVSNLSDLKSWSDTLFDGVLITKDIRKAMDDWKTIQGTVAYLGTALETGLGIMKIGDYVGHSGMFSGYSVSMFRLPSEEATLIVFLNMADASEPSLRVFMDIAKKVFPDRTSW